jgi:hypothetical protein
MILIFTRGRNLFKWHQNPTTHLGVRPILVKQGGVPIPWSEQCHQWNRHGSILHVAL